MTGRCEQCALLFFSAAASAGAAAVGFCHNLKIRFGIFVIFE